MWVFDNAVSIARGVMLSKSVMEGDGTVENFITIFRDGESELPLSFTIGVDVDTGVAAMEGTKQCIHIHVKGTFGPKFLFSFSLVCVFLVSTHV